MGTHAEHHQVFLYLDPEVFTSNGEPRHTHLEAGTRVSLETVRRLTCDTWVVLVLEDGGGSVVSVGRRSRTIPPAIRQALWLRERWRGRKPDSRQGGSCPVPATFQPRSGPAPFRREAACGRGRTHEGEGGGNVNPE